MIRAVVLAAGLGTRMKSSQAKVLAQICGRPLVAHVLNAAKEVADELRVVVAHQAPAVAQAVWEDFSGARVFLQNHDQFAGTGGAAMAALGVKGALIRELEKGDFSSVGDGGDGDGADGGGGFASADGGSFSSASGSDPKNLISDSDKILILCGDMPLVSQQDLRRLCGGEGAVNMAVFCAKNPHGYGRVIKEGGKIVKIVEQKDASEAQRAVNLCNAGAYCFEAGFLRQALDRLDNKNVGAEYYLTDTIEMAINEGLSVEGVEVSEGDFMGVNDKYQLSIAQDLMLENLRAKWMREGVKMQMPSTIYIDSRATFIGECEIEANAQIIGRCVIENSVIKSGSVIEESVLKNSDAGPMAHLRPKCEVQNSHIGNFVELKNARLDGVKAGHLSYLGDCEIGQGTNIGCGTITCNYDGKNKHRTIIGKEVFVGSDVQFIAPVNIADNTIIAAGSTVTADSQKGDLVVARARQKNIAGFFWKMFGGE